MAIMIDANFPGGGIEDVRIIDQSNVFFTAPVDGSLSNRSCWFYFRVRGAKGRTLTFRQERMERTLEINVYGTYGVVRPVVREQNKKWKRISKQDTIYDRKSLAFSFRYTPETDETWFAFCYPYQLSDLKNFFSHYQDNPNVLELSLGKTYENRDYPAYLLGCDDNASRKKLIFLKSRQHSGETPGSYVLEGLMEQVLADDELGHALRKKALFFVVPMVHLDGVENGHYGKDSPPVDFNRDWRRSSRRREIRAIVEKLDILTKRYPMAVSVDFHSPHPGGPNHIVPGRYSQMGPAGWDRMCQFRFYVEQLMEPFASNRVRDLEDIYFSWAGENYPFMETAFSSSAWGAECFSTESAYNCDRLGRPLDPHLWRKMGRFYAKAIYDIWLNDAFRFQYEPAKLVNMEILWDKWVMVSQPENIDIRETRDFLVLKARHDYERTYAAHTAFVAGKKVVSTGSYEICCQGIAKLQLFSYFSEGEDGCLEARADALTIAMENETLCFSCTDLCREKKTEHSYGAVLVAFLIQDLDGTLQIRHIS
jgi:hypothetical protein